VAGLTQTEVQDAKLLGIEGAQEAAIDQLGIITALLRLRWRFVSVEVSVHMPA